MEKFGNIGIYENLFPIFIKMNCYSLALLDASRCKKETFLVIFKQFMYYARPLSSLFMALSTKSTVFIVFRPTHIKTRSANVLMVGGSS